MSRHFHLKCNPLEHVLALQIAHSMGEKYTKELELISFHSTSKGFLGQFIYQFIRLLSRANLRALRRVYVRSRTKYWTTGECGMRGGYMELQGISTEIRDMMYKLVHWSMDMDVTHACTSSYTANRGMLTCAGENTCVGLHWSLFQPSGAL